MDTKGRESVIVLIVRRTTAYMLLILEYIYNQFDTRESRSSTIEYEYEVQNPNECEQRDAVRVRVYAMREN